MNKFLFSLALTAAFSAQAQLFHLGVDLTNPSQVVITATSANALANDASTSLIGGATLQLFFSSTVPVTQAGAMVGNLRPFAASLSYDTWYGDYTTVGASSDLNLFTLGEPGLNPQVFGTFFPAFSGSSTLDLSAFQAYFPDLGTSGPIVSGFSGGLGPVIGTWSVTAVPELPVAAHMSLYAAGFAGLWFYRRTRKNQG